MSRAVLCLSVLVLALAARGDDVDIYRDAQASLFANQNIVLVVDWAGAARVGRVADLSQHIISALELRLAWLANYAPASFLRVYLLVPGELNCDGQLGCRYDDYHLMDSGDLRSPPNLDAFGQSLEELAVAAADPSRGLSDYGVEDVWPRLRNLLDANGVEPGCNGIPVMHVLFESPVSLPASVDGTWTAGLRTTFVVPGSDDEFVRLAILAGGRLAVAQTHRELTSTLHSSMSYLTEVSSALMSASVPAFAPNLAGVGSDVLFPLFRPAFVEPWPGNLKALRLVEDEEGRVILARAPSSNPPVSGVDSADGAIHREALTYWTNPGGVDVQTFDPALGEVPGADGRSVKRGGAGQRLPGLYTGDIGEANSEPGARQIYLLSGEATDVLPPLNVDEMTAMALGLPTGKSLDDSFALLRYIRGIDAFDEDGDGDRAEARSWLVGSVMHSQPLIINYGARTTGGYSVEQPDVRVIYGSNDGLLRMLSGSPSPSGEGPAGREVWAALLPDMLPLQKMQAGLQPPRHPGLHYGVDGSPVVHVLDRNKDGTIEPEEGDRVWVYVGLRRGGRAFVALDLSYPDLPRFLWQITGTSPGFERLSLTFSTPRVVKLDLGEKQPRLGLIFAAGYNGGWEGTRQVGKDGAGGNDSMGNAIFVVDAATGNLLWRAQGPGVADTNNPPDLEVAGMTHSIPAPLTALDTNGNGLTDRAYVADSGGQLWRIDFAEPSSNSGGDVSEVLSGWSVRQLASLGGVGENDRRFFHAIDVAKTRDGLGNYEALLLVSGDRARPNNASVANFAYLIKDRGSDRKVTHTQLTDVTELCRNPLNRDCQEADLSQGWKLALSESGEKGLSGPLLRSGKVYFSTYSPPDSFGEACTTGVGQGSVYVVELADAAPALREVYQARTWDAETEMPLPDARKFVVGSGIPGPVIPYRDLLLLPGNGPDGKRLFKPPGTLRWRSHWRENGIDRP